MEDTQISLGLNGSMNNLRSRLIEKRDEGMLGVVAARSGVSEHVLRDWCEKAYNSPSRDDLQKLQDSLDNRKREEPTHFPHSHDD